MKKILLLQLILCLLLTGCKDKNEVTPAINDLIKGKWVGEEIIINYYNKANDPLFEKVVTYEKGKIYEVNEGKLKGTFNNRTILEVTYTLTKINGKDFITLSDGINSIQYEITKLVNNTMIWKGYNEYVLYNEGNETKVADYATYTEVFKRQ